MAAIHFFASRPSASSNRGRPHGRRSPRVLCFPPCDYFVKTLFTDAPETSANRDAVSTIDEMSPCVESLPGSTYSRDFGGFSRACSSARSARITASTCASNFAWFRFQPRKSAASRSSTCEALPLFPFASEQVCIETEWNQHLNPLFAVPH